MQKKKCDEFIWKQLIFDNKMFMVCYNVILIIISTWNKICTGYYLEMNNLKQQNVGRVKKNWH